MNTLRIFPIAVALGLLGGAAAAQNVTVTSWGGAYQTSQRKAYFEPYTLKTGAKIVEEEYNGEIAKIRAMVQAKTVTWDVVDVNEQTAQQGCDEGIFEPIDYSKVRPKEAFIPGAAKECAVGNIVNGGIFAYDADKIKDGPKSVADFFNLQKWSGKRGMIRRAYWTLEFALIGDGVPTDLVYKVLSTPEGVDRAFRKLDTIKSSVVWWVAGAQPAQLLGSGEVAMTMAWNGRIVDANRNENRNFKMVWDSHFQGLGMWAIPKGAKNVKASYDFIAFASDPAVMAEHSKYIAYGPTVAAALPLIAPDVLRNLPTAPDNSKTVLVANPEFLGDRGDELTKRFNEWLAR